MMNAISCPPPVSNRTRTRSHAHLSRMITSAFAHDNRLLKLPNQRVGGDLLMHSFAFFAFCAAFRVLTRASLSTFHLQAINNK